MTLLFIRSILLYIITLLAMKAMGKRQIGQLQPFELVVLLIISEMASLAMQSNTVPLAHSITPIVTITLLQILVSLAILKSSRLRVLFCGKPVAVIERGQLDQRAMARLRLNLYDLEELCRVQGYFDISSVEYAVMETNGSLSILPRTEKRPLQVDDVLPDPPPEQLSRLFILDGRINPAALRHAGLDEAWLLRQLHSVRIDDMENIFIAGVDDRGSFFFQKKDAAEKKKS